MYFDKRKYLVQITGGKGLTNTETLRGMVVHMIVRPQSSDTMWDLTIYDKEQDEMVEIVGHTGRFDEQSGIPLGKDTQEMLTIHFKNVTRNEQIGRAHV